MKSWIKVISVVVLIGFIAGSFAFYFLYNKPHPDFEKAKADYTLAASALYKDYLSNKAGSGVKYNGKVIELTGMLPKVEISDTLVTCVFVFNQGMFGDEGVRCTMLPKFREEAKKIAPGSAVKLKGYCTGFNDTDVILEKCSIVK